MGKPLEHGKPSSYNNHGCRCELCKTAWAEYMRPRIKKYRQEKKEREARRAQKVQIRV